MEVNNQNVVDDASSNKDNSAGQVSNGQAENKSEFVAHSTFKKLLGQHKNLQEKARENEELLMQYQAKEKEAEKKRLEEKGEYKKLLDLKSKELEKHQAEANEYKKRLLDAHKLNAFCEKLPGKIANPKYFKHVETENILIDPETGIIDETSLTNAVNSFLSEHNKLLDVNVSSMPSDATTDKTSLTYDEWLKLPYKKKKETYHLVYNK